jgi:hypothetical protein
MVDAICRLNSEGAAQDLVGFLTRVGLAHPGEYAHGNAPPPGDLAR